MSENIIQCKVCGEGSRLNAHTVCAPCWTFVHKLHIKSVHTSYKPPECKLEGKCEVNVETRTNCAACRLKKFFERGLTFDLFKPVVRRLCLVCGDDEIVGNYYGSVTCKPCSDFFKSKASKITDYQCFMEKRCEITVANRANCVYCRLKKCLDLGMAKKEFSTNLSLCEVCNSNRVKSKCFDGKICGMCKNYFKNSIDQLPHLVCKSGNENCEFTGRGSCRYCRIQKCLKLGMKKPSSPLATKKETNLEVIVNDVIDSSRSRGMDLEDPTVSLAMVPEGNYDGPMGWGPCQFTHTLNPEAIPEQDENLAPWTSGQPVLANNPLPSALLLETPLPDHQKNMVAPVIIPKEISDIHEAYKENCRFYGIKDRKDSMKLRHFTYIFRGDELASSVHLAERFFTRFLKDILKIENFLQKIPISLSDQFKRILLKKNIISLYILWILDGIDEKGLLFPNGKYLFLPDLEVIFDTEIALGILEVAEEIQGLGLSSVELSLLIPRILLQSDLVEEYNEELEKNEKDYCIMLKSEILKRENGLKDYEELEEKLILKLNAINKLVPELMKLYQEHSKLFRFPQLFYEIFDVIQWREY